MAFSKQDLQKFHVLKTQGNELYDLAVPGMQEMYDGIVLTEPANAYSRDTSSFEEIRDGVEDAARKHQGDGLVILSGAYQHMIGAVADLQKDFNIEYVPVEGMQISTATKDPSPPKGISGLVTEEELKVQMRRNIGVTKSLGYDSMEALREAIESKPHDPAKRTLVVIGLHETGLHYLDTYNETKDKALAELEGMIPFLEQKPEFVSYIGEDLHVNNIRQIVVESKPSNYPRNAFLQKLHQSGIPVEIGAFGHRDRAGSFGDRYGKRDPHIPDGSSQGKN